MNELNKHTLTQTAIARSMNELNKHTLTQTATAGSLNELNKHPYKDCNSRVNE
jgi:hypothetical protein